MIKTNVEYDAEVDAFSVTVDFNSPRVTTVHRPRPGVNTLPPRARRALLRRILKNNILDALSTELTLERSDFESAVQAYEEKHGWRYDADNGWLHDGR